MKKKRIEVLRGFSPEEVAELLKEVYECLPLCDIGDCPMHKKIGVKFCEECEMAFDDKWWLEEIEVEE